MSMSILKSGIEVRPIDILKMGKARDLLEGVRCNAALLLHEDCREDETLDHLVKYMQRAPCRLERMGYGGNFYREATYLPIIMAIS
jgi:hypothetical protein